MTKAHPFLLTAEKLRELLHYDPETGIFTWLNRVSSRRAAGQVAGVEAQGYIRIGIRQRQYMAHRLAILYMSGVDPLEYVDHINGIRSDNRFANLRAVSHKVNMQNEQGARSSSKTKVLGVSLCKKTQRYRVTITINGKSTHVGRYDTVEEASEAYLSTKRKHHEGNTL